VCRVSDKLENVTEQDIPQIVTKYMRFVCWITKPSDTHSNNMQYVLLFKDTKVTRTRLNITLYFFCLSGAVTYELNS